MTAYASSQPLTSANVVAQRFASLAPLAEGERRLLDMLSRKPRRSFEPRAVRLAEGAEVAAPLVILSGWACRMRELADGRRQLIDVMLPGDAAGVCARARPLALTTVAALTTVRAVDAPELKAAWRAPAQFPHLSEAVDLALAQDEAFLLGHVVRLGRQTAFERLAHFIMELEHRLASRGLANNGAFAMPLTQEVLADILGLSVVHVNRTLQQMRREGLIELRQGRLSLLNREPLVAAAEFRAPVSAAAR
jgi:CRP-like cAMP-binding protein